MWHPGVEYEVAKFKPRIVAPGVHALDVSVLTDVRLMDGKYDTVCTNRLFTPLGAATAQPLAELDWNDLKVKNVGITGAAVLGNSQTCVLPEQPDT